MKNCRLPSPAQIILTMKEKTHLEIAENYVDWAAARNMTAGNVWRTLCSWPALKLTRNERRYIKVLAEKKCPAEGWTREIKLIDGLEWVRKTWGI